MSRDEDAALARLLAAAEAPGAAPPDDPEAAALRAVIGRLRAGEDRPPPATLRVSILAALDEEIAAATPWWRSPGWWKGLAVAASLAAAFVWLAPSDRPGVAPGPPPVRVAGYVGPGAAPTLPAEGALTLGAGQALTLDFRGQGPLTLTGPGRFELGATEVRMRGGRVESRVDPPDSVGFRVVTPTALVRVVGTHFEVTFEPEQGAAVTVFEGEVEVEDLRLQLVFSLTPDDRDSWQQWSIEGEERPGAAPGTPPVVAPPRGDDGAGGADEPAEAPPVEGDFRVIPEVSPAAIPPPAPTSASTDLPPDPPADAGDPDGAEGDPVAEDPAYEEAPTVRDGF